MDKRRPYGGEGKYHFLVKAIYKMERLEHGGGGEGGVRKKKSTPDPLFFDM